MAKAKHPKLKWTTQGDGDRVAGAFAVLRSIGRPGMPGMWKAYKLGGRVLGFGHTVAEAKAIAQAFADAETLRGEPA